MIDQLVIWSLKKIKRARNKFPSQFCSSTARRFVLECIDLFISTPVSKLASSARVDPTLSTMVSEPGPGRSSLCGVAWAKVGNVAASYSNCVDACCCMLLCDCCESPGIERLSLTASKRVPKLFAIARPAP